MMTEWTYLKKGDKRPMGRVLVAHGWPDAEWKLRAAIFGDADEPPPNRIDIAVWHPDTSKWCRSGPRLDYIKGVYAWMPLPPPPAGETNE